MKRVVAAALVFSGLLMAIAFETGLPSAARQEPAFTIHKVDGAHFAGTNGLTFMLVIGRDGRALLIVQNCPHCHGVHTHSAEPAINPWRRSGCGQPYLLET